LLIGLTPIIWKYLVQQEEYLPPDPSLDWPKNGSLFQMDLQKYSAEGFKIKELSDHGGHNNGTWDIAEDSLKITYPAGSFGGKGGGGVHFSMSPKSVFENTTEACLSYYVKFPSGFDWVLYLV
jgi:hypothetical protein